MAECRACGLQPQQRQWYQRVIEQRNQTVNRTHELHSLAIGTLIRHHLGYRQFCDTFFQRRLQTRRQRFAFGGIAEEKTLCLAIAGALKLIETDVIASCGQRHRGEFFGQWCGGLSFLVQRDRHRQYLFAHLFVSCNRAHAFNRHRQSAG